MNSSNRSSLEKLITNDFYLHSLSNCINRQNYFSVSIDYRRQVVLHQKIKDLTSEHKANSLAQFMNVQVLTIPIIKLGWLLEVPSLGVLGIGAMGIH
jgi:hypothetical protein